MNHAAAWDAEHRRRYLGSDKPFPAVEAFVARRFPISQSRAGVRWLEVGCGTGSNTLWLAQQGFDVWGFDSSCAAIERALPTRFEAWQRRSIHLFYEICDATMPWPYSSGVFDIMLDVRTLENLDAQEAVIAWRETARVLKPGGTFLSITAAHDRDPRFTTVGHVRCDSESAIRAGLRLAGFGAVHIIHSGTDGLYDWHIEACRLPPNPV